MEDFIIHDDPITTLVVVLFQDCCRFPLTAVFDRPPSHERKTLFSDQWFAGQFAAPAKPFGAIASWVSVITNCVSLTPSRWAFTHFASKELREM
jgi:hypothetical protein